MEPLLDALKKELIQRKDYLDDAAVNTIYFGGGTPSILEAAYIGDLLETIHKHYPVAQDAEITLEANPDDLSHEKLSQYHASGINRLSIGIQSFHEADIRFLNRAHTARQAEDSILAAQGMGIQNISIDLIYGIPGQSDEDWIGNLDKTATFGLPHISAYSLTVEEKTALAYMINKGTVKQVDDETAARHFTQLQKWCLQNGYDAYEISNYAKAGWYSRHNSAYWQQEKYLGIGPSAHSFNGMARQWNIANNSIYIGKLTHNEPYWEKEDIGRAQRFNEYIMTALRTAKGADLNFIKTFLADNYIHAFLRLVEKHKLRGHLISNGQRIYLSEEAKFLSDGIISDLFIVDTDD